MSDFISEIKKIATDKLIYTFSELSIKMYKNEMASTMTFPFQVNRFGFSKKGSILLTAWDIPSIEYFSIKNSNDYRKSDKLPLIPELVNLFRIYENDLSSNQNLKNNNSNKIFRVLLGMSSEQFLYQRPAWIFEKLNRSYHILVAAKNYEHREELDVNFAIQSILGFTVEDYLIILLIVFWLCTQHPAPLTAPENLYKKRKHGSHKR